MPAFGAVVEGHRAPLAGRGEGTSGDWRGSAGQAPAIASAVLLRSAALATTIAQGRANPSASLPIGTQLGHGQPVGGQRAGLVRAQHIDVAERLDGVGLLDQRAVRGTRTAPSA